MDETITEVMQASKQASKQAKFKLASVQFRFGGGNSTSELQTRVLAIQIWRRELPSGDL